MSKAKRYELYGKIARMVCLTVAVVLAGSSAAVVLGGLI